MNNFRRSLGWFHPGMNMLISALVSLITAIIAFYKTSLDRETMVTFGAYFLILGAMTLMFWHRQKLVNPKTRQLLQFSFFLFGFVLMVTGGFGMLNGSMQLKSVFLLMLFFPGLATLRAGLYINKQENE